MPCPLSVPFPMKGVRMTPEAAVQTDEAGSCELELRWEVTLKAPAFPRPQHRPARPCFSPVGIPRGSDKGPSPPRKVGVQE